MDKYNQVAKLIESRLNAKLSGKDDHITQLSGASKDLGRHQLVIGLDFGTAFTKLIVGDLTTRQVVPLVGPDAKGSKYLLRGECTFFQDDTCKLGRHDGHRESDMKMRLIDKKWDQDTLVSTICLVALILRWARLWVLLSRHQELDGKWIDWALNVGLPTESYENEPLYKIYKEVMTAAWIVSTQQGEVSRQAARQALGTVVQKRAMIRELGPSGGLALFPEFAAQVAAYLVTPMRREGMHLLVDVGAGTVDDTIFNVHEEDDQEKLPILARSVVPFGARFLHRERLDELGVEDPSVIDEFGITPRRAEFAKLYGITKGRLEEIDEPFRRKVIEPIRKDLVQTKKCRYPMAREWTEGIPTFLTGGGARMDLYQEVVEWLTTKGSTSYKLERVKVPEPNNLSWPLGRDEADYDRVMVAYGLSMDAANLAQVVPSSKVDDIKNPIGLSDGPSYRDNYIDKDMM